MGSDAKLLGSVCDPALPRALIPRVDCVSELLKDHGVVGEEQLQQLVNWGGNVGGRQQVPHLTYASFFQGTENSTIIMVWIQQHRHLNGHSVFYTPRPMQAAIPILTWSIAKALQPPDRPALPPLGKNTTQWLLPSQCSRTSLQRRQVPTGIHSASLANIRRQAYSSTFNICIESHV